MPTVQLRQHPELTDLSLDERCAGLSMVVPSGLIGPYAVSSLRLADWQCKREGRPDYPGGLFYVRRQRAWLMGLGELRDRLIEAIERGKDRLRRLAVLMKYEGQGLKVKSLRFRPVHVRIDDAHGRIDLIPEIEVEAPGIDGVCSMARPDLAGSSLVHAPGSDHDPVGDLPASHASSPPIVGICPDLLPNPPPGDDAGIETA